VHSLLYTEIPAGITWRAFVAAGVVWVVGLGWPLLVNQLISARWPIKFNDLLSASSSKEEMRFKEFTVAGEGGRTITYTRRKNERGLHEYVDAEGRQLPLSAPLIMGVREDNGEKIAFKRETETKSRMGSESTIVRYVNAEQGLVMATEQLGTISSRVFGQFALLLLGGLITLAAWFVALWLLMLIQWLHALAISLPAMLVWMFAMNLVV
jgi:hypothetical protein